MTRRALLVLLLALALVPYFVGLGDSSIWDANEAFYAETPREMIEHGDWINPSFNYLPRFNKPVLSYWIVGGFYKLFGVSVGVERLPMAIAAVLMMVAAFVIARSMTSTDAGLWAAIAIATSPRVLMFARRIFIDVYVTMFMSLALMFFVLAERRPERRTTFLLLMYAAMGLGTLTKGPVAIVLPVAALGAWLIWEGRLRDVRRMRPIAGAIVVLAIVAPWYVALYAQHGWTYIVEFFWSENVARYTDAVAPQRGLLFYPPVVLGDMFPWSLALVPAAAAMWWTRGTNGRTSIMALLWTWIIVIVGFFSLSKTKQDLYIFPIVVAVAALAGDAMSRADARSADAARDRYARWVRWVLVVAGALLIGLGLIVARLFMGGGRVYELQGVLGVTAIAIIGGAAAMALGAVGRSTAAAIAVAATMIGLNYVFVIRALPSFERYKPVPPMSAEIRARAGHDAVILHYNVALPSMAFYLQRHVEQIFEDPQVVVDEAKKAREFYLVTRASDYQWLRHELPPTCIIGRELLFDVKLKNVLARQPLPELLLVTNKCGN